MHRRYPTNAKAKNSKISSHGTHLPCAPGGDVSNPDNHIAHRAKTEHDHEEGDPTIFR
jgi:hypothetical protein